MNAAEYKKIKEATRILMLYYGDIVDIHARGGTNEDIYPLTLTLLLHLGISVNDLTPLTKE